MIFITLIPLAAPMRSLVALAAITLLAMTTPAMGASPLLPPVAWAEGVAVGVGTYTETTVNPTPWFDGNCSTTAIVTTQVVFDLLFVEVAGTSGSLCDVDAFFDFDCYGQDQPDGTLVCTDRDDDDGFVDTATLSPTGEFNFRAADGADTLVQTIQAQLVRVN